MSERTDAGADLTIAGAAGDSERTDAGADLTIARAASDSERTDAGADLTIAGAASDSERTDAGADLTIAGAASDSERTDAGADLTIAGAASDSERTDAGADLTIAAQPVIASEPTPGRTSPLPAQPVMRSARAAPPSSPGSAGRRRQDRASTAREVITPGACRCWRGCGCSPARNAGAPLPPGAAGEVGHAATAIVAEADAAGHAAVAAARKAAAVRRPCSWPPGRPATAADADVVAAAADGSAATLSRHLRRFEALTSALWTVQHAICVLADRRPSRRTWQHRLPDSKPGCAPAAGS